MTLGLAAGAAALAFAGSALALDEVTFGTNWLAEAEHGGFYQAVADGTYEKYGLKVTIVQGGPQAANQALLHRPTRSSSTWQGNLLGTFSAVEQDIPVVDVAAIFQKDPQILMAHPDPASKNFADLAKLPTIFIGKDLLRHRLPVDEGGLSPASRTSSSSPTPSTRRRFSPTRCRRSRATSPPSPTRSRRKAASSRSSS